MCKLCYYTIHQDPPLQALTKLPGKQEMAVVPDSTTAKLIGMFWFLQQAY